MCCVFISISLKKCYSFVMKDIIKNTQNLNRSYIIYLYKIHENSFSTSEYFFLEIIRHILGRHLSGQNVHLAQSPGFSTQHSLNWVWWLMSGIPALRGGGRRISVQDHSWLHNELKTSLGYTRPCCKRKRKSGTNIVSYLNLLGLPQ